MSESPVVIVLAGGKNSRFWPLEQKTLFDFLGQPLLVRHLEMLRDLGCRDFVIVASPDNVEGISSLAGGLEGIETATVVQERPLGMGDALLSAAPLLGASFDGRAIYVTQAHDVADRELHAGILDAYRGGQADGYVQARRVTSYFEGGYLKIDGGRVTAIVEKPGPGNEPSDVVKLVADVFCDWRPMVQTVARLAATGGDDIYERALTLLFEEYRFEPVEYSGPAHTIKFPWHVLDVMEYFLGSDFVLSRIAAAIEAETAHVREEVYLAPDVHIPPGASVSGTVFMAEEVQIGEGVIVQGPVYLDRGVRLAPRTTVIGPAYLGPGVRMFPGALVNGPVYVGLRAIIGNNALVRQSIIGGRSEIGFSSEVARSYVGPRCELHTNYVGDSVLAEGVHLGSGAVTANLRLDYRTIPGRITDSQGVTRRLDTGRNKLGLIAGAYAQAGINSSIMPGQRIGRDSIVGAAVMLDYDLPDNRMVRLVREEDGALRLKETDVPVKRSEVMQEA